MPSPASKSDIGILGGTFNPIHNGHLFIAEYLAAELGLERVLFVPCGRPPHKRGELASVDHRCRMIEKAISDNSRFRLCRFEVESKGLSYSIRTVKKLKQVFPKRRICFLIGADNIREIPTWKEYRQLLRECRFVAISRGFGRWPRVDGIPRNAISRVKAPSLEIASTTIRERVGLGKSIRYWVPEAVASYIGHRKLYKA